MNIKKAGRQYLEAYADCYRWTSKYVPPVKWLVDATLLHSLHRDTKALRRELKR